MGGRSRREESGVRGGNKKTFHPGFSTSDPWTEPNSTNLQTGYKQSVLLLLRPASGSRVSEHGAEE